MNARVNYFAKILRVDKDAIDSASRQYSVIRFQDLSYACSSRSRSSYKT
jgi:hypothetical protein